MPPIVSILIPVYNRMDLLAECLRALARQTYPAERMEIIVIDNGSEETPPGDDPGPPAVRVLHEPTPGSYAARNTGLRTATGEILAFTDADCIPAADWIERGVAALAARPEAGLVVGRIDLFCADGSAPGAVEAYELLTAFNQAEYASRNYGATANVFTRRTIMEEVGDFKATLLSGGDQEWGRRVAAHGHRVVYADDVVVAHPARATAAELFAKKRRVIGGEYDRTRATPRDRMIWRYKLVRRLVPPLGTVKSILLDRRVDGFGRRVRTALVAVRAHYVQTRERWRLTLGGRSRTERSEETS